MTEKPESAMKREKFKDLMRRYHGQMENALYAAEQVCPVIDDRGVCQNKKLGCPFENKFVNGDLYPCSLRSLRMLIGDRVQQDDIQIPDDNTPFERKMRR